jgi:hypothetical protein
MVVTFKNVGCNAMNLVYRYQFFAPILSFPEDGDTNYETTLLHTLGDRNIQINIPIG